MIMSKSTWSFALALAAMLWGIVLVINWLGPGESLVSIEQVVLLEEGDKVERVLLYPDKLVVDLNETLYLRVEGRNVYTNRVYVPRDVESKDFEMLSIKHKLASGELVSATNWVGEYAILFFIVIGLIFIGLQIRQDRRFGSPRRHIADLDAAFRNGQIEESAYKKQLEDLLPKL